MIFGFIWFVIGFFVWIYYVDKNKYEYDRKLESGELKIHNFLLGWILTHLFWPITIYNQEKKRWKK
jgi:hypothetical protein